MASLKSKAISNGFYRDTAGIGYVGYHIVLKTNNTFDLYKINSWASLGNCYSSPSSVPSWSIGTQFFKVILHIPQMEYFLWKIIL